MIDKVDGSTSDGFHTFDELYAHRCHLFAALMVSNPLAAWKSRKHSDGSSFEGWFVCGMTLGGKQVSYHLPESMWDLVGYVDELETAPEWDGHTPADVVARLAEFCSSRTARARGEGPGHDGATPTPWSYDGIMFVWGPFMEMVADVPTDLPEGAVLRMRGVGADLPFDANARLVCAAVNSHAAHVALVETVERFLDGNASNASLGRALDAVNRTKTEG
jgi:hypothetical protein